MTNEERKAALEAIIYAADEPATIEQLMKALGEEKAAVQASLRIISSEVDIPLPRLAARLNEFLYRATPANKSSPFSQRLSASGVSNAMRRA